MKLLKKALPVMLAVIMVLAMGTTAFAAGNGSITVNNMETGKTYEIYRVFDMTISGTAPNQNATYTISNKWVSAFFNNGTLIATDYLLTAQPAGGSLNEIEYNGTTYYLNVTESNVADFANYLNEWIGEIANDGTHTAVASDNGSYTFSNLDLGYYLVFPVDATSPLGQNSSVCSLTNTKPAATVIPKGDYPTVDKEVNDQDVEVGQTVTFTVTLPLPGNSVLGYDEYWYKLTDTMTNGLTFGNSFDSTNFTVKLVYDSDPTNPIVLYGLNESGTFVKEFVGNVTYGTPTNGFTLLMDIRNYVEGSGELVITYNAIVNENAVVNYTENLVEFEFGHDPEDLLDGGNDKVPVYSSEIIVEKYDAATENEEVKTYLADAQFVLYRVVEDDSAAGSHKEYYEFTPAGTNPATPATVTWVTEGNVAANWSNVTVGITNASGLTTFTGLESGTYYLQEIEAPSGYNKLANDIQVVINAPAYADDDTNHTQPIGVSLTKPVANSGGSVLPETGGIGTTIFYVLGVVLLAGAGITLFVRRRMSMEK